MAKCPRCFQYLADDVVAWTEASPRTTSVDEEASAYRGDEVQMGKVVGYKLPPGGVPPGQMPPEEYAASELGGPVIEVCPICHYHLPPHWRSGRVTCIAMAGARFTGKTVFIAVMIKQLERLLERGGREIDPVTNDIARRYHDFYQKPLYEQRGIIPPTPPMHHEDSVHADPLIFSLGIWNGVREYLSIRDVAGEDLENPQVGGTPWHFFSVADAVLFMFDPMRVDEVRELLRDLVPTGHTTGGDPRQVLRTVMRLIGDGTPKLGVVLSKFDALQDLQKVAGASWGQIMSNAGAAFSRDPGLLPGPYDHDDGWLLHAEVHSLLAKLDAGPMLRAMRNPVTDVEYNHRFFAVSALGDTPHGERINPRGISPFRCLDPVRWVFADNYVLT